MENNEIVNTLQMESDKSDINELNHVLPLSKEQDHALKIIAENKISVIQYLDKLNLAETISYSIMERLSRGKRTLLVIESEELGDLIVQHLNNYHSLPYVLRLQNNDFLNESQIATVRTHYKNHITQHVKSYTTLTSTLEADDQKIKTAYQSLTQKIFGERKWMDLAMIRERTNKIFHTGLEDIELELSQKEFWHIRGRIEEAKSLYSHKTYINENILSKFNISIENEKKINLLKESLIRFKIKLEHIIHDLESEFERYRNKIIDQIQWEFLDASTFIDEARVLLQNARINSQTQSKNGIFSLGSSKDVTLDKQYSSLRKKLEKNILIELDHKNSTEWNAELIRAEILHIQSQLADWKNKSEQITVRMVKSLNKNNSDSEQLKNIDQYINILFSEIHESGIFRQVYENTGMSTYNQYNQLQNILKNIKVLLSYIRESTEMVLWESFYNQQPVSFRQIIDILKRHEVKDWIPLFEKWYLEKLLMKYDHPYTVVLEDLLTHQKDHVHLMKSEFPLKVEDMFAARRQQCTDLCKTRNKNAYQNLFRKKTPDHIRAFDLIWCEKEMLTVYFPVMILSSKLLKSNRLLKDGNWDQLYVEGTEIFNFVEKYTILERKTSFFTPLSESFKVCNDTGVKLDDKNKTAKLLIHQFNYEKSIKELPVSERLKAAKKLAKILLSLHPNIRIFNVNHHNIISVLNPVLSDELWSIFDGNGIKEVNLADQIYESVTESILDIDSKKILLYQDHILQPEIYSCYLWQLMAIEAFRTAGYEPFSVQTKIIRKDFNSFASQLKERIKVDEVEKTELSKEA